MVYVSLRVLEIVPEAVRLRPSVQSLYMVLLNSEHLVAILDSFAVVLESEMAEGRVDKAGNSHRIGRFLVLVCSWKCVF